MQAALIVAGIRGLVRVSRAGSQALLQYELDRDVLVPKLDSAGFSRIDFIRKALIPKHQARIEAGGDLADYWEGSGPSAHLAHAEEVLLLAAVEISAEEELARRPVPHDRGLEIAGETLIRQWAEGKGPVDPLARFLVSLADAALEVVGAHPSVLGIDGNGERLVGAFATHLAALIPDDADAFGPKSRFADRLLRIVLRAGLETLSEHTDAVIPAPHLGQLTRNLLAPVISALPGDLAAQSRWRDATDALLGPAARAAFQTLAADPDAFLGRELDPGNALGALARAMLETAAQQGLRGTVSEAGLVALFRAGVGVAAERPELFLGDRASDEIARALFATVAETLRDAPSPFDDDLGVELFGAALGVLRQRLGSLAGGDTPWERVAGAIVGQVLSGLQEALAGEQPRILDTLLSRRQLLAFARVFVEQAARTPEMATASSELAAIVRAVATAMARDESLLLAPDGWIEVAAAAAAAAAADPGRLFPRDPALAALGGELLLDLVAVAVEEHRDGGRAGAGVLFGETLREALLLLLDATASQPAAAQAQRAALQSLARQLSLRVRSAPDRFGSREWLWLYRQLLPRVLAGETLGDVSEGLLLQVLQEGGGA